MESDGLIPFQQIFCKFIYKDITKIVGFFFLGGGTSGMNASGMKGFINDF